MKKIDRIINNLREMMVANSPGESGGFTSSSNSLGPTAGFDQILSTYRRRKNNSIDMRSVPPEHRRWLKTDRKI